MGRLEYKPLYHRNLPHIQPLGATFFTTFRLAGSVPQAVVQGWLAEKRQFAASPPVDADERAQLKQELKRRWFRRLEVVLHEGKTGPPWLRDQRVASLMVEALHYRDGKVYRLDAFCVMPNHVHKVSAPLPDPAAQEAKPGGAVPDGEELPYSLAVIMHSLKGYTARKANIALGRRGGFWEHESYDHAIRDEEEWQRIVWYVLNNPVNAGLVKHWREWPWSYYRYDSGADE